MPADPQSEVVLVRFVAALLLQYHVLIALQF